MYVEDKGGLLSLRIINLNIMTTEWGKDMGDGSQESLKRTSICSIVNILFSYTELQWGENCL